MKAAGRVVQLGKFYAPDLGGVETLTAALARGFALAGLRSEVVVFGRSAYRGVENGVAMSRHRMLASAWSQPLSVGWMFRAASALAGKDPVILHMPNILGALVALVVRRAPLIVFWHSDLADSGRLGRLLAPLQMRLVARADLVWVTSDDYVAGSPALRHRRDRTRVLVPGVAAPSRAAAGTLPADLARFVAGRRLVLAVGRLVAYKGFDQLIEAARRLHADHAVLIVGDGPERAALDRQIARLGLRDTVMLAGRLTDEGLGALFRTARVLVMTSVSRRETFGMVQIEALAHGVPIVVTEVEKSGVASVSGYGSVGALVPQQSPQALADAIERVTQSPDWATLSTRARSRYEARFTIDRMVHDALRHVGAVTAGR